MELDVDERDLLAACTVLFGDGLQLRPEFLDYLQMSGLKGAFRRQALMTHPDRYAANPTQARSKAETFHQVREAFERLRRYLELRDAQVVPATPTPRAKREPQPFSAQVMAGIYGQMSRDGYDFSIEKPLPATLPQRTLLFGHFLYYSGIADWRTIVRILIWQRCERPRLGELGCRFGWLRQEDIPMILRCKNLKHPFGETAIRLGLLNENRLHLLLCRQRQLHKKFGTILVEKNLLQPQELEDLLVQFRRHNAEMSRYRNR